MEQVQKFLSKNQYQSALQVFQDHKQDKNIVFSVALLHLYLGRHAECKEYITESKVKTNAFLLVERLANSYIVGVDTRRNDIMGDLTTLKGLPMLESWHCDIIAKMYQNL